MFWNYEKQAKKRAENERRQKEYAEAKACLDDRRRTEAKERRLRDLESDLINILNKKDERPCISGLAAWVSDDLYGLPRSQSLKSQIMKIAREEIDREPIPIVYGKPKKK